MNDLINLYKIPVRGTVSLQSSSVITSFFISLFIILKSRAHLDGSFDNDVIERFSDSLKTIGIDIDQTSFDINLNNVETTYVTQDLLSSYDSINFFYFAIILLDTQGFVEIKPSKENLDFINLCKYLGFKVTKAKNVYKILNVVTTPKESLTFHENNLNYFLISMLLMFISNNSFTISTPQIDYNIAIVLDILKTLELVSNVEFGDFVKIQFSKETYSNKEKYSLKIPGDCAEFIFWIFLTAITNGELKIMGANSRYYAETLKILSDLGIGFEAVSENEFKVWGSVNLKSTKIEIRDDDPHLELTKLCMVAFTITSNILNLETLVSLDSKKYKNFISDLNILGSEIKVNESDLLILSDPKLKSGDLYLNENAEYENYAKLLFILGTTTKINVKYINNLLIYNSKILLKLSNLGSKLTYATTE
ncbi:hypothetical protein KA001_00345 [Patescibacteria group bacterium]|nr:hypothetical protein [Patescibacteria group bacterium]